MIKVTKKPLWAAECEAIIDCHQPDAKATLHRLMAKLMDYGFVDTDWYDESDGYFEGCGEDV